MMIRRCIAIALVAASLGLSAGPALAQGLDAPVPAAPAVPAKHREAKHREAKPKVAKTDGAEPSEVHAKKAAKPSAAAAAAPVPGGETEASSLERRRRAFFGAPPDEVRSDEPGAPTAGVTLGGSGGISPGMGFKF